MEKLDWLEWNPVTSPLKFEVVQHGAFPENIKTIELSRNSELNLVAIGRGEGYYVPEDRKNLRLGELLPYPEDTTGKTKWGADICLKRVVIHRIRYENFNSLYIEAKVDEAEVFQPDPEFLPSIFSEIEWIINFKEEDYLRLRNTERKYHSLFILNRGEKIIERTISKSKEFTSDHFRCKFCTENQEVSLIVGYTTKINNLKKYNFGFLEFENLDQNRLLTKKIKHNILMALSFTLGRRLVSIGSTSITKEGNRICFTVKRNNFLVESAYQQDSKPPTLLTLDERPDLLDESKVSTIISAIVTTMKTINLEHSLFLMWLGLTSPLDVQAAHFGAAIESLRDAYCESTISNSLISKNLWKNKIKKPLIKCFDEVTNYLDEDLSETEKSNFEILRNKIEHLNQKSSNMQYEDFFDLLSLNVGKVELEALKERNKPAHGYCYKDYDYDKLFVIRNALYSLFNRIILKITNASNCYIDYSTYDFPVRNIDCPLGGPEGDGIPAKV